MNTVVKDMMERGFNEHNKRTKEYCCVICKEVVYLGLENDKVKGRIYSDNGLKEFDITSLCETCFDRATLPDE